MIRNTDEQDNQLTYMIAQNPGISFTELHTYTSIPASTLRYRLTTLELEGIIKVKKSRNANTYFLAEHRGGSS